MKCRKGQLQCRFWEEGREDCCGWDWEIEGDEPSEPSRTVPGEGGEMKESPCASWTPDCQGKWDYDGRLLSISTRYWPAGLWGKQQPSAHASIILNFGEPDQYGYGDYHTWREQYFSGDTKPEVKARVEAWVQERFDEVRALLGMTLAPQLQEE